MIFVQNTLSGICYKSCTL